jgi:hypothetical protein
MDIGSLASWVKGGVKSPDEALEHAGTASSATGIKDVVYNGS